MTEIRVDIRTIKGCKPCDTLYKKLSPMVKKRKIPISMSLDKRPDTNIIYPVTCIIVKDDGTEIEKHCIPGYYDGIVNDFAEILDDEIIKGMLR